MKYMLTYDLMEAARNTNQWLGATAHALASYPVMSWGANPMVDWLRAWGDVTERTFSRMVVKPDWGIPSIAMKDGRDHVVQIATVVERPFGDLIHFKKCVECAQTLATVRACCSPERFRIRPIGLAKACFITR